MSVSGPPSLEVRGDRFRLSFDGRLVTLTRTDRLGRQRSIRQYGLADFHYLQLSPHGNDSVQVNLLDIHHGLRPLDRLTIRKPGRPVGDARAIMNTVNEARAQRIRAVLKRTVGLGPWSVQIWDQIRSLIMTQGHPEPWPPGSGTPDSSRAIYEPGESAPLHQLAHALTYVAPGNRYAQPQGTPRFPELGGFTTPIELLSGLGPGQAGHLWNGIITALEGDHPVIEDRQWDQTATELLRWGHDQVDRHRTGRSLTHAPHGRPSWAID